MNDKISEADEKQPSSSDQAGEQRGLHRMVVRWDATVSAATTTTDGDCLVLDISPGGARIQTPDPLPAATPVALTLERGGRFDGKVAWQEGSYFGIAFDRPYDDFLAA